MIFVTGAVVLALEVLASRILTPYFGVSLYIWSGILSITLTFLAVGYYGGSALSRRLAADRLEFAYLAAPALSALAIAAAAAIYPVLFPALIGTNLVLGSFVGSAVLLALPLVALSAMNPLLVALRRGAADAGDAGAGRVFFISTVGSVAGVLVTAFLFIPLMTNFVGLLVLALVLCGLVALAALAGAALRGRQRAWLLGGGALAALLAVLLMSGQDRYLALVSGTSEFDFAIEAEHTSVFGNIKVVRIEPAAPGAAPFYAFLQDGLVQNRAFADGVSLSLYTHFLEALTYAVHPAPRDVLVLGLGAGIVPRNLDADGLDVTAVEINRDALAVAQRFFRFDPGAVDVRIEDARTYVRRCESAFDVAVVDLFHGDNTPDYLMTREFFQDVARCLRPDGVMAVNAFFDPEDDAPNRRVRATILAAFPTLYEFRSPDGAAYLAATRREMDAAPEPVAPRLPPFLERPFAYAAANMRRLSRADLAGVAPITDAHNVFKVVYAESDRRMRRNLASGLPIQFLVN